MEFNIKDEEYLTLPEVEKLIGLKRASIENMMRYGVFPKSINLNIRRAWRRSDIENYLKANPKKNKKDKS